METKITVLFYLKRAKINSSGLVPIFQRITILGERLDRSTSRYIDPGKWSSEAGRIKSNSGHASLTNSHLDKLYYEVLETEKRMIVSGTPISMHNFRQALLGPPEKVRTLVPIFRNHNEEIRVLSETGEKAKGTWERYETTLKHISDFLKFKHSVDDIPLNKIDLAFISDFDFYLRSQRQCNNNTTVKYVKNLHKIIQICLDNKWKSEDPFIGYKGKTKEVTRYFLNEEQLMAVYNKTFKIERLNIVKDIFIFSCFTGLAYIDVKKLTSDHINYGIDGTKWIFKDRQKTDTRSSIPLLPIPLKIIERYSNYPKSTNEGTLLPVLSNQKMNAYLKEIADICEIPYELTFHIARHTFATTVTLTNGVPIESVSKMLGHRNISTTQHYAKVVDRKISADMANLREKFSDIDLQNKKEKFH